MNPSNLLLSQIVHNKSYAMHLTSFNRREIFNETVNRNITMHLDKFPKLSSDILKAARMIHDYKVMPSMRSMQFGGQQILKNNTKLFNCSFAAADYERVFAEALYVLLCGTGFGFSCQKHHVAKLPSIKPPTDEGFFIVHDSIAGWAEALDRLMSAYFNAGIRPIYNFNNMRPRGTRLSSGAKTPGYEPLKILLEKVESKLKASIGRKLTTLEIHDIMCIIADGVLSGGIRRAALISLFSHDDLDMLTSKHGQWWDKHPYRARANNSAVLDRATITEKQFQEVFDACIESNAGEPGFMWTNSLELGANPCLEIALNSNQFCNLTSVNLTGVTSKKELHNRVYAATLLGTLQASYTDFPYLNQNWKKVTEREALLGVSFTGIADNSFITPELLRESAQTVLDVNEKYARKLGINLAARTTCVKPEGSASCIVGSSSGIHARHAEYYLRRVRMNKDDALAKYLSQVIPDLVENDLFSSTGIVVTIPQESPKGSITRHSETAESLFERIMLYNKNWVKVGHREGLNQHNVSCTISYKPSEVDFLRKALWENRQDYTGISLLPFDGGNYQQAPFEDCDKATFDKYSELVQTIDLTKVIELEDNTNRQQAFACVGGGCEVV